MYVKHYRIGKTPEMDNPEERFALNLTEYKRKEVLKIIKTKDIEIIVRPNTREKYSRILKIELNNHQKVTICQTQLLSGSRIKVECKCDYCGNSFHRQRNYIQGEVTLCGRECRNRHLASQNVAKEENKVSVNCSNCESEIKVFVSKFEKQKNFLCSRKCYSEHRSRVYKKENVYNYQNIFVECSMCKTELKTSRWHKNNKEDLFCSQECYWKHRSVFYKEKYYSKKLNNSRKETNPERLVRKWLENNGVNFRQEIGWLKKYYTDFYLPDEKVIIEVFGDYWHVNPEIYDVYGDDPSKKHLNKMQIELIESDYDNLRKEELESHGYPVYIIWEKDINENVEKSMSELYSAIKSENPKRLARSAPL